MLLPRLHLSPILPDDVVGPSDDLRGELDALPSGRRKIEVESEPSHRLDGNTARVLPVLDPEGDFAGLVAHLKKIPAQGRAGSEAGEKRRSTKEGD